MQVLCLGLIETEKNIVFIKWFKCFCIIISHSFYLLILQNYYHLLLGFLLNRWQINTVNCQGWSIAISVKLCHPTKFADFTKKDLNQKMLTDVWTDWWMERRIVRIPFYYVTHQRLGRHTMSPVKLLKYWEFLAFWVHSPFLNLLVKVIRVAHMVYVYCPFTVKDSSIQVRTGVQLQTWLQSVLTGRMAWNNTCTYTTTGTMYR